MREKKSVYVMFIFLQSVLYGIGNPVTKIAFESLSVYWCLALRFSLAFLVLMLFFGRKIRAELRRTKLMAYLPASFCMAAAYICQSGA